MTTLAPRPGQTVGPFFGYALPYDGDRELVPPGHAGRRPPARHGVRRRRARRCPTRCSRSGRPTRRGASSSGTGRCAATATRSPAGAGARTDADGALHLHHARARRRRRRGRRSSRSRSSPAACSTGCSPAPTCRDDAERRRRRCSRRVAAGPPRDAGLPSADEHGLPRSTSGCRATTRPSSCAIRDTDRERPLLARRRAGRRPDVRRRRRWRRWCDVEAAWLAALVAAGSRRRRPRHDLTGAGRHRRPPALAAAAEAGGNPGHRRWWRCCAAGWATATRRRWLHRGLTSQDVVDTALMLLPGTRSSGRARLELHAQVRRARAARRRSTATTPMVGADADPARRARSRSGSRRPAG